MSKTIATIIGVLFIVIGLAGFVMGPTLDAIGHLHLGPLHNVVHLVSGGLSLYLGLKGPLSATRLFCLTFGAVYGLLGVIGFVAGDSPGNLLHLPGLTLGTMDHLFHIAVGALYLIGGALTKAGRR